MINTLSFTAELSLYETRNHYRLTAGGAQASDGEAIIPQQFPSCTTNRSCWGVILMARDHCQRWDGSSFSSLWYVNGVCFGLFQEFFEFDF
jgi:hypothetical protein